MISLHLLASALLAASAQAATGYIDLSASGGVPDGKASGILYGVPNGPAYTPNPVPAVPWNLFKGAGINLMRAGGAQVPAPGWSSGDIKNYEQRFESAKQNYFDTMANGVKTFVLLPHDMWGADSVTKTPVYPCDNGDCTYYGQFLDRVIADLKANNMLKGMQIDVWNEPDVPLFWDRSQDQYFQMWDYAFQKYRTAFPSSSGVTISGPAYTGPPNEGNSWWTKWADHMKNKPAVYPDVITYHQLLGRQDSFNDPFESKRVLDIIQSKNNLPRKLVQVNEYAGSDEQSPAYSAWFIGRFERTGQQGLRANWGYGRNLHNDFARLVAGVEAGSPYTLGDWHVYNYYTQVQKGSITRAGADDVLWDLFVTQNRGAKQVNALVGSRGQGTPWNSPDFPITMSSVSTVFGAATKVRAVIKEIPFNNAGRVDAPTVVSNATYNVVNNRVVLPIYSRVDNAYTIDVYAA
ncbi:glycoside hydrolase superfamily [Filobasidium floriforme]|uniref:glycoside hydrolase superfamily n=1 Tax=Filobasidium floriforme TaxID=5210 RepID=UPI001E8D8CE3|nr:glycoside hydrolase superfamily [Filobasidium floriforme]KAH8087102.1 glycoside hydrolase superfamily [Filobasidium floriforme]